LGSPPAFDKGVKFFLIPCASIKKTRRKVEAKRMIEQLLCSSIGFVRFELSSWAESCGRKVAVMIVKQRWRLNMRASAAFFPHMMHVRGGLGGT
jgi:hypothetical protein